MVEHRRIRGKYGRRDMYGSQHSRQEGTCVDRWPLSIGGTRAVSGSDITELTAEAKERSDQK